MSDDADLRKGPLKERIFDSKWKARKFGWEDLKKLFENAAPEDKVYEEFAPCMAKGLADKNQAAQTACLEALNALLEFGPPPLMKKLATYVCKPMGTLCLKGRGNAVQQTKQAFLMLVELECSADVVEGLLEASRSRVVKIVPVAVNILTECFASFGVKVIPPQPVFKAIGSLFDHKNDKVRTAARSLVIELHRWLGSAIDKCLESLRPAQLKDLQTAFADAAPGRPKPTRLTRSQQSSKNTVGGGATADDEDEDMEEEDDEIDPYSMFEPVDVLGGLPGNWIEQVEDKKWKARKEALEALVKLADTPRIKPGDFSAVVARLRKILAKDVNVMVVAKAAQAVSLLANGLRADFASCGHQLIPALLAKLKEKKASVIQQLHSALDPIAKYCVALKDELEGIDGALKNKIPKVRLETLCWLERCVFWNPTTNVQPVLKSFATMVMKMTDDRDAKVRDEACNVLAALVLAVGERRMKGGLADLDKIRKAKVDEAVEKLKAKREAEAPQNEAPPAARPAAKKKKAPVTASTTAAPAATKKKQAPTQRSKNLGPAAKVAKPKARPADVPKEYSADDCASIAEETLEEKTRSLVSHENPRARLKAIQDIATQCPAGNPNHYPVLLWVSQQRSQWSRENNFQVLQGVLSWVTALAGHQNFDIRCVGEVAQICVSKIGDFKLAKSVGAALDEMTKGSSVQTMVKQMLGPLAKMKSPKSIVGTLKWFGSAFAEYGLAPAFDEKSFVDYLKAGPLVDKAAATRKAAVGSLGELYKAKRLEEGGTDALRALIGDGEWSQAVDEHLALVDSAPKPEPPSTIVRLAAPASSSNAGADAPAAVPAAGASSSPEVSSLSAALAKGDAEASFDAVENASWDDISADLDSVCQWLSSQSGARAISASALIIQQLVARNARLSDQAAGKLIPALVSWGGDQSKQSVIQLSRAHPASSIGDILLSTASGSMSAAVQARCLQFIRALVDKQALTGTPAIVTKVAAHVMTPIPQVSEMAAGALFSLRPHLGSSSFSNALPAADRQEILAKIEQASKVAQVATSSSSTPAAAATTTTNTAGGGAASFSDNIDGWRQAIREGDETQVVNAVKSCCAVLVELKAADVDALAVDLVGRLNRGADTSRARKYAVNGLLTVVSHSQVAACLGRTSIAEITKVVLDELASEGPQSGERQAMLKALNVLMFRTLENASAPVSCDVLLSSLLNSMGPVLNNDYQPAKITDLIMKCLIKLGKGLVNIEPASLAPTADWIPSLQMIHSFLTQYPPASWKTRVNAMPLKCVKTILNELTRAYSATIMEALNAAVKHERGAPPPIVQYVQLMLKAKGVEVPKQSAVTPKKLPTTTENANPNEHAAEDQSYLARLNQLRQKYGLESVELPAIEPLSTEAPQPDPDDLSSRITGLRARLRAVRAPYDAGAPTKAMASASQETKDSIRAAVEDNGDRAQALMNIRERLQKLKNTQM